MKHTHLLAVSLASFWFILFRRFNVVTSCHVQKLYPFDQRQIHIAALVLARGGSKGIKLKNLTTVNGKTLLAISLEEILKLPEFRSVWVSTDHDLIYKEAVRISKEVNVHWRSEDSATDTASSIFAVQEFLSFRPEIDVVALIQCTSPFVHHTYLKNAILLMMHTDVDCVFSVSKSFKLRWIRTSNSAISALNFDPAQRPRRQDWEGEFVENGMFYFAKRSLLQQGVFQNQKKQTK
ncbi:N-acylneuraminate cytidylyltransferase-like isoform X2 [Atheta coriaria]|uniref:N-acylneuraminate cytidylyltransferase-like isoform X2 n=1 Tax=Dalotia coriaria TaxID=877792 RepID=UPI0031F44C57